jgi:hypothetical protein
MEFWKAFDSCQVHNMLVLMLDPHFISLYVVEFFFGCGNAICLVVEDNVEEDIPLLMTIFYQLKPIV